MLSEAEYGSYNARAEELERQLREASPLPYWRVWRVNWHKRDWEDPIKRDQRVLLDEYHIECTIVMNNQPYSYRQVFTREWLGQHPLDRKVLIEQIAHTAEHEFVRAAFSGEAPSSEAQVRTNPDGLTHILMVPCHKCGTTLSVHHHDFQEGLSHHAMSRMYSSQPA